MFFILYTTKKLILSGDSGSFEYEPCLARNRLIDHLAIHGTHALSVHNKYLACLGHLLFSRGQDFIDDRDLCRMDCAFAMKAKTRRSFCLPFETVHISNVEIGRNPEQRFPCCLCPKICRHIRSAEEQRGWFDAVNDVVQGAHSLGRLD